LRVRNCACGGSIHARRGATGRRVLNDGQREFTPPSSDAGNDWVLVIDDAAQNFPAPEQGNA
jgi:hypothetical protein